jgi:hypothetical protein
MSHRQKLWQHSRLVMKNLNAGGSAQELWCVELVPKLKKLSGADQEAAVWFAKGMPSDPDKALDLVGLNSYVQMLKLPEEIAKQGWTRPYVVTEFGPRGHWQVPKTPWKVPIEDDANSKAEFYLRAYQHSVSGQAACLGSYVFYWAHKQERVFTESSG